MNEFKLENQPKIAPGFKTPEHYFDTLSENIQAQLELDANEPKVISFYQRHKKMLYAAAAALVLALSIPFFMQTPAKVSDVDETAFENYMSYNTKITSYELAEYLDKDDIENLKVDYEIPNDVLEESLLNNIDVEHYIVN